MLDYHVHLKGISADEAAAQSRRYGINYALAPNCGIGFPITSNEEVLQYLKEMEGQPFIQAMQGEGRSGRRPSLRGARSVRLCLHRRPHLH